MKLVTVHSPLSNYIFGVFQVARPVSFYLVCGHDFHFSSLMGYPCQTKLRLDGDIGDESPGMVGLEMKKRAGSAAAEIGAHRKC